MSAYTDAAPILSKAVGVTLFKQDNPAPIAPVVVEDKAPTVAKTTSVYNALLSIEQTGIGYSGVRRLTGVSVRWIKVIHAEMAAAKAAVYPPVVVD